MKYPNINIADGLNLNPVPLEFSQSLTTTKWLGGIESKINKLIDFINEMEINSNSYTDELISNVKKELDIIRKGDYLEDKSITLEKLSNDFLLLIENLVNSKVGDSAKMVTFGLDDDGYFIANIPKSWNEIEFTTDLEGHLILKF